MQRDRTGAPTVEQLRSDIDSGRTGDKVAAPDPAAAPLGTDDEAGGTPPRPDQVAASRMQERSRGEAARAGGAEDEGLRSHGRSLVIPGLLFGLAAAAVMILATILLNSG